MEKASTILGRALRRMHQPEAAIVWLQSEWPRIVGPTLATHTRPIRCEDGKLQISADAKAWQNQIETLRHDVCERINEEWGRAIVREIMFLPTTQAKHRISPELDMNHTPFVRRRKS